MNTFYLCVAFIALHLFTSAQDFAIPKNRIPIPYTDFMAYVLVYDGKVKTSSLDNARTYYWVKAKQIHQSKGGYEGDLLHGEYTALYRNDQLKEKGSYYKGLKTGEWKEWHPNGELKLVSHYKKGFASGTFFYYNEYGKIIQKEIYRNGKLHGHQHIYTDSSDVVTRYKNGKSILPKAKHRKEKVKIIPGKEIEEPVNENGGSPRDRNKRNNRNKRTVARDGEEIKENQPATPEGSLRDKKDTNKEKKEKVARDQKHKWLKKNTKPIDPKEEQKSKEPVKSKKSENVKQNKETKQG